MRWVAEQTEKHRGHAWPLLLAALLFAGVMGGCGNHKGANPSGTLEAVEVNLAGTLSGKVLQVRAREGEHVQKGDTLVLLDTEQLSYQRQQAVEGERALTAQLASAKQNLVQAQTGYDLATLTLKRVKALAEQGSATQQKLDEARTAEEQAQSQVASVRNQIEALGAEKGKLVAGIQLLESRIRDGVLLSPLDGIVLSRSVEPGEVLGAGATAMRIADLSHLKLRVYLSVSDVDLVKLGQPVTVYVDALEGDPLEGKVSWISSEAEFTPKNVQTRQARTQLVYAVKVELANPDGRLAIGMPAEMVMPGEAK